MTLSATIEDIYLLIQLEMDIKERANFNTTSLIKQVKQFIQVYNRISMRFAKDKNLQLKLKLIEPKLADYFIGNGRTAYTRFYKWSAGRIFFTEMFLGTLGD